MTRSATRPRPRTRTATSRPPAYDGDGRVTSVTQPAYTPPGRIVGDHRDRPPTPTTRTGTSPPSTDPGATSPPATYDALGDVTSVTDPQLPGQSAPGTWTYTYDADGEQLSATDPLGNTTQADLRLLRERRHVHRPAAPTPPSTPTTTWATRRWPTTPGRVGHREHLRPPGRADLGDQRRRGHQSTYDYDDQGNLADANNPDGSFAQYGYDQAGQPDLGHRLRRGRRPGRRRRELRSESFGYDPDGDQTSAKDWNGDTTTYGVQRGRASSPARSSRCRPPRRSRPATGTTRPGTRRRPPTATATPPGPRTTRGTCPSR